MKSLNILSLGLGVQSTALYFMSSLGELPRVDHAIFIDLGREKAASMKYLEFLLKWKQENNGVPITIVTGKNLFTDLLNSQNSKGKRFSSIPAFTANEDGEIGMLRRQCTGEYKIAQVDKAIRYFYEKKARQRLPKTNVWKGISFDERERMSVPPEQWKIQVYPFIGYTIDYESNCHKIDWIKTMSRDAIIQWYVDHNLPVPPKSACVFCPYQSDRSWYESKTNAPEDFAAAVLIDEAIRNSITKGITQPAYLHRSCIPLKEIEFKPDAPDLWNGDCSGVCHN